MKVKKAFLSFMVTLGREERMEMNFVISVIGPDVIADKVVSLYLQQFKQYNYLYLLYKG